MSGAEAYGIAEHLVGTGMVSHVGELLGQGIAKGLLAEVQSADAKSKAAPELYEAVCIALDQWFELHYGQNDIGMAALIRNKLRDARAKADGR